MSATTPAQLLGERYARPCSPVNLPPALAAQQSCASRSPPRATNSLFYSRRKFPGAMFQPLFYRGAKFLFPSKKIQDARHRTPKHLLTLLRVIFGQFPHPIAVFPGPAIIAREDSNLFLGLPYERSAESGFHRMTVHALGGLGTTGQHASQKLRALLPAQASKLRHGDKHIAMLPGQSFKLVYIEHQSILQKAKFWITACCWPATVNFEFYTMPALLCAKIVGNR